MVEFLKYFSAILFIIGIIKITVGTIMHRKEKKDEQD